MRMARTLLGPPWANTPLMLTCPRDGARRPHRALQRAELMGGVGVTRVVMEPHSKLRFRLRTMDSGGVGGERQTERRSDPVEGEGRVTLWRMAAWRAPCSSEEEGVKEHSEWSRRRLWFLWFLWLWLEEGAELKRAPQREWPRSLRRASMMTQRKRKSTLCPARMRRSTPGEG